MGGGSTSSVRSSSAPTGTGSQTPSYFGTFEPHLRLSAVAKIGIGIAILIGVVFITTIAKCTFFEADIGQRLRSCMISHNSKQKRSQGMK